MRVNTVVGVVCLSCAMGALTMACVSSHNASPILKQNVDWGVVSESHSDSLPVAQLKSVLAFDGTFDAAEWPGFWQPVAEGGNRSETGAALCFLRAAHDGTNLYFAVRAVDDCRSCPHGTGFASCSYRVTLRFPGLEINCYADGSCRNADAFVIRSYENEKATNRLFLFRVSLKRLFPFGNAPKTLPFNCEICEAERGRICHFAPVTSGKLSGSLRFEGFGEPRWVDVLRADSVYSENPLADSVALWCNITPRGNPVRDVAKEIARSFRRDPKRASGVHLQATMGHGVLPNGEKPAPWQKTIEPKYNFSERVRYCPLDLNFQAYIANQVRTLAALQPDFFIVDDDVRLEGGCFCPLHLSAYAKRTGRNWTRDQLVRAIADDRGRAEDWRLFTDETISILTKTIRAGFPAAIPGVFCTVSSCHGARQQAEILAGKDNRPCLRIGCAPYWDDGLFDILWVRSLVAHQRAVVGLGVDLLQEADTCPHSRWRTSGTRLCDFMATLSFEGARGALMWISAKAPAVKSRDAYAAMLGRNCALVHYLSRGVNPTGVKIVLSEQACRKTVTPKDWGMCVFGRLGIPYCYGAYEAGDLVAVSGDEVKYFTEGELGRLLGGRALLDQTAVKAIQNRGLGNLLTSNNLAIIKHDVVPYPQHYAQMWMLSEPGKDEILSALRRLNGGDMPGGAFYPEDGSFMLATAVGPDGDRLVYLDNLDLDTVEDLKLVLDDLPKNAEVFDDGVWRPVGLQVLNGNGLCRLGIKCETHRPQLIRFLK